MAEQVLVPLKRNDRVEEIISYVEKVNQPGMEVVFLVRYPADRLMIDYRGDFKSYDSSDIDSSENELVARSADIQRTGKTKPVGAETPVNAAVGETNVCRRREVFSRCVSILGKTTGGCVKKSFSRFASLCAKRGVRSVWLSIWVACERR